MFWKGNVTRKCIPYMGANNLQRYTFSRATCRNDNMNNKQGSTFCFICSFILEMRHFSSTPFQVPPRIRLRGWILSDSRCSFILVIVGPQETYPDPTERYPGSTRNADGNPWTYGRDTQESLAPPHARSARGKTKNVTSKGNHLEK